MVRRLVLALAALMLLAVTVGPASAQQASGEWHRNNYNSAHERRICREATPSWSCVYDNVPEPGLPGRRLDRPFHGPECHRLVVVPDLVRRARL